MRCRAGRGYSSRWRELPTGGVAIHAPSFAGKTRPRTSLRSAPRARASTSGGMTSSPSPMAMASMASWWHQSGSREAAWPPTTTNARGLSRLIRCARRMVRLRSVVKLHCRPTTSASKARQSARPCSSPSMRMSMTLHSCPSRSRHAATQIGPSGSTKVCISAPRMPPIAGFRKATFTLWAVARVAQTKRFALRFQDRDSGIRDSRFGDHRAPNPESRIPNRLPHRHGMLRRHLHHRLEVGDVVQLLDEALQSAWARHHEEARAGRDDAIAAHAAGRGRDEAAGGRAQRLPGDEAVGLAVDDEVRLGPGVRVRRRAAVLRAVPLEHLERTALARREHAHAVAEDVVDRFCGHYLPPVAEATAEAARRIASAPRLFPKSARAADRVRN